MGYTLYPDNNPHETALATLTNSEVLAALNGREVAAFLHALNADATTAREILDLWASNDEDASIIEARGFREYFTEPDAEGQTVATIAKT